MVTKEKILLKNPSSYGMLERYRRAISKYITGVTMRDNKVDEISPPIMTQASGA